jgi:hypothetical protein
LYWKLATWKVTVKREGGVRSKREVRKNSTPKTAHRATLHHTWGSFRKHSGDFQGTFNTSSVNVAPTKNSIV